MSRRRRHVHVYCHHARDRTRRSKATAALRDPGRCTRAARLLLGGAPMPHHAARTAGQAPQTAGRTIHAARWYDLAAWLCSFGREPSIRRRTVELAGIRGGESVLGVGCGTGTLRVGGGRRGGGGGGGGGGAS